MLTIFDWEASAGDLLSTKWVSQPLVFTTTTTDGSNVLSGSYTRKIKSSTQGNPTSNENPKLQRKNFWEACGLDAFETETVTQAGIWDLVFRKVNSTILTFGIVFLKTGSFLTANLGPSGWWGLVREKRDLKVCLLKAAGLLCSGKLPTPRWRSSQRSCSGNTRALTNWSTQVCHRPEMFSTTFQFSSVPATKHFNNKNSKARICILHWVVLPSSAPVTSWFSL